MISFVRIHTSGLQHQTVQPRIHILQQQRLAAQDAGRVHVLALTRSMKNCQQFSGVSMRPEALTSLRTCHHGQAVRRSVKRYRQARRLVLIQGCSSNAAWRFKVFGSGAKQYVV